MLIYPNSKIIRSFDEEPLPRYHTVYADPAWPEIGGGVKGGRRGADRHYKLMSVRDILSLSVKHLAYDNAHCYIWVTNNYLKAGLECLDAWGFRYVTNIVWIKANVLSNPTWLDYTLRMNNPGLGQYFRGQHELCLFGVRGVMPYKTRPDGKRAQHPTVIIAPRQEHSRKPEKMRRAIELVSHPPYIELFSRIRKQNWDCWGNEV